LLLGHRYYDPSVGRFLTRDRVKDGRNWYVYGYKQVVVDPSKEDPETLVDAPGLELSEGEISEIDSMAWEYGIGVGAAVLGGVALLSPEPFTKGGGLATLGTGAYMMGNAKRRGNILLKEKLEKHKKRMSIALARIKSGRDVPVAIPVEITSLPSNSGAPAPPPFFDPNLPPIFRNPSGFPFPKDPSEFLDPSRRPYLWSSSR
jgi:hypothetical protein